MPALSMPSVHRREHRTASLLGFHTPRLFSKSNTAFFGHDDTFLRSSTVRFDPRIHARLQRLSPSDFHSICAVRVPGPHRATRAICPENFFAGIGNSTSTAQITALTSFRSRSTTLTTRAQPRNIHHRSESRCRIDHRPGIDAALADEPSTGEVTEVSAS